MSKVYFSRKPYTINYRDFHSGEMVSVTRRPPPKMHDILPSDLVELKSTKNVDWKEGEDYTVKHISPRYPNTLQLINGSGETTFVASFDVDLTKKVASRGEAPIDDEVASEYLTWP